MKPLSVLSIIIIAFITSSCGEKIQSAAGSYHKLTTSNGLIVAVYDAENHKIVDAYPHIFANYDSGNYVNPFVGNISLKQNIRPVSVHYLGNTHIIEVRYPDFSIYYFASFIQADKILYAVIRGKESVIRNLDFEVEYGEGTPVSNVTLLENPLQDLPVRIKGHLLTGQASIPYQKTFQERYFLFSFTDSLHQDSTLVNKRLSQIQRMGFSLLDAEADSMRSYFSHCIIPQKLSVNERNLVEQSISILRMAQVSDKEIFPFSHGQVLAAVRPGLWHIAWVRDGSFALQAMAQLGMYEEAKKGLEFMLKAPSDHYVHYIYKDGKDYGPGVPYQISLTRYFGNGEEECDYTEDGPNIEFDDLGLFLAAYSEYVECSHDSVFFRHWYPVVSGKVAQAIIHATDTNSLLKADSGPWEHHLTKPRQYAFTSGVCARGLERFALLAKKYGLPFEKQLAQAHKIKEGMMRNLLVDGRYFRGNATDTSASQYEYYDAGTFEIFADGLMQDKNLFKSHLEEYDRYLRIKANRPGYIRLNTSDPYENQEWVFIDLRIASAHLLLGSRDAARSLIGFVTQQAAANYNTIPEMYSNKLQIDKVPEEAWANNVWCNCIRQTDDQYIGTIPMVGYGSAAYILALYSYYNSDNQ